MITILVLYKGKISEWCKLPYSIAMDEVNRLIKAGYPAHIAPGNTKVENWEIKDGNFVLNDSFWNNI